MVSFLLMILSLKINSFVIISKQIYGKYRISWYCWCSSEEMEANLMSEYGMLHDIKNDIVDRLKSDAKNHANSFPNCI
jgi:hypothetical protein